MKLPSRLAKLKVCLAHDWLTGMRGGEKVLEAMIELFPTASLYTLLHVPGSVSQTIEQRAIHTSLVQKLPNAKNLYRHYLPLFPLAVKNMQVESCDLLLSISHCAIKALNAPDVHISYVNAPMRYVWSQFEQYYQQANPITKLGMKITRPWLQHWDASTSGRVDGFISNSQNIAAQVKRYYKRDSLVVHPPVDLDAFTPQPGPKNYYLVVSALVPYKRVDLAIAACNQLGAPLKVVGSGPQARALRALAGPTVEFLGWRESHELNSLYANAKAFLFPGEEDFGITPLEAMACGCPVLAYGNGGALETVLGQDSPNPTGRFFYEQSVQALVTAMQQLEADLPHFEQRHLLTRAAHFAKPAFQQNLLNAINKLL